MGWTGKDLCFVLVIVQLSFPIFLFLAWERPCSLHTHSFVFNQNTPDLSSDQTPHRSPPPPKLLWLSVLLNKTHCSHLWPLTSSCFMWHNVCACTCVRAHAHQYVETLTCAVGLEDSSVNVKCLSSVAYPPFFSDRMSDLKLTVLATPTA